MCPFFNYYLYMKHLVESIFDDNVRTKGIVDDLANVAELIKKSNGKWVGKKKDFIDYGDPWEMSNIALNNSYWCFVFGQKLKTTHTSANFDTQLKKLSVVQYLANKYKVSVEEIINILKKTGFIKIVKFKDLLNDTVPTVYKELKYI